MPVQKLIFGHFWNCKKWNLVKNIFYENDLFDFTSFFGQDFFKYSGPLWAYQLNRQTHFVIQYEVWICNYLYKNCDFYNVEYNVHFLRPQKLKFQNSRAKILDSTISNECRTYYAKVHLITWDIWREKQFLYANSNLEFFFSSEKYILVMMLLSKKKAWNVFVA